MLPLITLAIACGVEPPRSELPVSGAEAGSMGLRLTPVGALEVGTVEVDNALFRRFRPAHTSNRYQRGDRTRGLDFDGPTQPAIVTWDEALAFCAWASTVLGRTVRLPTEAEWVAFADRIPDDGTLHRYANGADATTFAAIVAGDDAYPQDDRLPGDDGFVGTAPVGGRLPNAHGLFDVWGNVTEWTATPHGPGERVLRGGAWNNGPRVMAGTNFCGRAQHYDSTGFRVVVEPAPPR